MSPPADYCPEFCINYVRAGVAIEVRQTPYQKTGDWPRYTWQVARDFEPATVIGSGKEVTAWKAMMAAEECRRAAEVRA